MNYIAHIRKTDSDEQTLEEHLFEVADLASKNAEKFGLAKVGELLGLLHDVGKYSASFQSYIRIQPNDQDADYENDFSENKPDKYHGKVDHSTAGAQYVYEKVKNKEQAKNNHVAKLMSLCLASHHSGLIDCVSPCGEDTFLRRVKKNKLLTNYEEIVEKLPSKVQCRIDDILQDEPFIENVYKTVFSAIVENERIRSYPKNLLELRAKFKIGLFARMLFSCLIDADHTNTANFENPNAAAKRLNGLYEPWSSLHDKLETYIAEHFSDDSEEINKIRNKISSEARLKGESTTNGIFTLTVPTGGGKTLASLRFALSHAKSNEKFQRVIYVIPFTSIIDQNAEIAREILGDIVLEHHSNITDEKDTWKNKILSENWDAPVIFTTMVQFFDAMFGRGTRDARRMHKLANSVIIFDEIQTLPIRLVHMFCNSINFLADSCNSTIVLCTATQPLLQKVDEGKGNIFAQTEIVSEVDKLFEKLKRVKLINLSAEVKNCSQVADLAIEKLKEQEEFKSCLIVVNTTKTAREIYKNLKEKTEGIKIFHLSARMCAVHRMKTLDEIKKHLENETKTPMICISTQVIEAGVDVDFGVGIRSLAGMDSIAQTSGRVNRNGKMEVGFVYIVKISDDEENISRLEDILIGQQKAGRIFDEVGNDCTDLFHPSIMKLYYTYYFHERKNEMDYKISQKKFIRDDSLLDMLSLNSAAVSDYQRENDKLPNGKNLCQSFKSAANLFRSIDSDTIGIVVQYGVRGKEIVAELCSKLETRDFFKIMHEAQRYSVNVYKNMLEKLDENGAIHETSQGSGIFYVEKEYYSNVFGLCEEQAFEMENLITGEESHE